MDAWRATSDAKYGVGRWWSLTIPHFDFCTYFELWRSSELTWSCWFFLAVVYNFDGSVSHGLRLTIGETVHILEECAGEICVYRFYKTSKVIFDNMPTNISWLVYLVIVMCIYWFYGFRIFCGCLKDLQLRFL